MGEGLAEVQLGKLEHQNGMRQEGLHTSHLALELFESFRGAQPGAILQRRIDSAHYPVCRALSDDGRFAEAWRHRKIAIGETELRAAHPQNRYLQEEYGQHELADVLGRILLRREYFW